MSHTYKNLKSKCTPGVSARRCADQTPLVHCIRRHVDREKVIRFLTTGDSMGIEQKHSTVKASNTLGIPADSTFFYAGRAFPEDGIKVAMLYGGAFDADKSISDRFEAVLMVSNTGGMSCGARPFDSGGLANGHLSLRFGDCVTSRGHLEAMKMYFDDHNVRNLSEFRPYFALFLKEFFAKPADYWSGVPCKKIDNTMFGLDDDLRNWTFELHSEWKVPPSYANDIIIDDQIELFMLRQAGLGDIPSLAPVLKNSSRFHHEPGIEADRTAKKAALRKKGK